MFERSVVSPHTLLSLLQKSPQQLPSGSRSQTSAPWAREVRDQRGRLVAALPSPAAPLTAWGRGKPARADTFFQPLCWKMCVREVGGNRCCCLADQHEALETTLFRFRLRTLHTISLEFRKMLQQITQSVTLVDQPFFKSLLTSWKPLSLLNSRLTQLPVRNKEAADPSPSAQTPLTPNKTTPWHRLFSITLTLCRKRIAAARGIAHACHALDIWL